MYLADFLKTNLTKFAVIWVKRRQKAGFLAPISSKLTLTREKNRRKRKSKEEERRRREKSNGCTLSFYNGKSHNREYFIFYPANKGVVVFSHSNMRGVQTIFWLSTEGTFRFLIKRQLDSLTLIHYVLFKRILNRVKYISKYYIQSSWPAAVNKLPYKEQAHSEKPK